jgi:hypothetical protein
MTQLLKLVRDFHNHIGSQLQGLPVLARNNNTTQWFGANLVQCDLIRGLIVVCDEAGINHHLNGLDQICSVDPLDASHDNQFDIGTRVQVRRSCMPPGEDQVWCDAKIISRHGVTYIARPMPCLPGGEMIVNLSRHQIRQPGETIERSFLQTGDPVDVLCSSDGLMHTGIVKNLEDGFTYEIAFGVDAPVDCEKGVSREKIVAQYEMPHSYPLHFPDMPILDLSQINLSVDSSTPVVEKKTESVQVGGGPNLDTMAGQLSIGSRICSILEDRKKSLPDGSPAWKYEGTYLDIVKAVIWVARRGARGVSLPVLKKQVMLRKCPDTDADCRRMEKHLCRILKEAVEKGSLRKVKGCYKLPPLPRVM